MSCLNVIWSAINTTGIVLVPVFSKFWIERRLQRLRSDLSKGEFIHKLQFEKEFSIYDRLWKRLIDLRTATAQLIPILDLPDPKKTEEEIKKERLHNVTKKMSIVRDFIEDNRPFYDNEVYEKSYQIMNRSISQIFLVHYPLNDVADHYQKAQERVDEINRIILDVEHAIRGRINNMGKAKIVG